MDPITEPGKQTELTELRELTEYSKLFGCNIHDSIRISPMAQKIIATQEFQRMRSIKQLGLCHLVFSGATHTRFEHSIGVYHLAGKILEKIYRQHPNNEYIIIELSNNKMKLDNKIIECIKIAGLCHDIGHGPFSHIFDDVLLADIDHPNKHHENRSCLITEIICKRELSDELTDKHISFIKSIINPGPQHKGALYQIVSNYLNGIDVDKLDYLTRDSKNLNIGIEFNAGRLINEFIIDINGNIAYPKHCSLDVYKLFHSRYIMHKTVYTHKTVKLLEMMLRDIFILVDPVLKISNTINDMELFCKLTDNSIFELMGTIINPPPYIKVNLESDQFMAIKKANSIYQRIVLRKLYKQVIEFNEENEDGSDGKKMVTSFIKFVVNTNPKIRSEDLFIFRSVRGFVSGNKNPFDSIYFYDKMEDQRSFTITKNHFSGLINNKIQEISWHVYCKDPVVHKIVKSLTKDFGKL